jgi:hypothetical protein
MDDGTPRRYKVDFPNITQQALTSNPNLDTNDPVTQRNIRVYWHNQPLASRYTNELVELNLRRGAGVYPERVFRLRQ